MVHEKLLSTYIKIFDTILFLILVFCSYYYIQLIQPHISDVTPFIVRDIERARVISSHPFLLGPNTGPSGYLIGPLFYYLIRPFVFLNNPVNAVMNFNILLNIFCVSIFTVISSKKFKLSLSVIYPIVQLSLFGLSNLLWLTNASFAYSLGFLLISLLITNVSKNREYIRAIFVGLIIGSLCNFHYIILLLFLLYYGLLIGSHNFKKASSLFAISLFACFICFLPLFYFFIRSKIYHDQAPIFLKGIPFVFTGGNNVLTVIKQAKYSNTPQLVENITMIALYIIAIIESKINRKQSSLAFISGIIGLTISLFFLKEFLDGSHRRYLIPSYYLSLICLFSISLLHKRLVAIALVLLILLLHAHLNLQKTVNQINPLSLADYNAFCTYFQEKKIGINEFRLNSYEISKTKYDDSFSSLQVCLKNDSISNAFNSDRFYLFIESSIKNSLNLEEIINDLPIKNIEKKSPREVINGRNFQLIILTKKIHPQFNILLSNLSDVYKPDPAYEEYTSQFDGFREVGYIQFCKSPFFCRLSVRANSSNSHTYINVRSTSMQSTFGLPPVYARMNEFKAKFVCGSKVNSIYLDNNIGSTHDFNPRFKNNSSPYRLGILTPMFFQLKNCPINELKLIMEGKIHYSFGNSMTKQEAYSFERTISFKK